MTTTKHTLTLLWVTTALLTSSTTFAGGSKTTICHKPDSKHPVTIRIATLDVPEHLAKHGDYIGLCPTAVGAEGATISIPGEIVLHIPAGSVTEPTDIYIKRISGSPGSFNVLYELGPDGFTSNEPIEVTIAYDPAQIPSSAQESDLLIADFTERMQPLQDSVVDTGSKTVSGTVNHFSLYGMGVLTSTGVNVNQFGSAAGSWRMPIGDLNGVDVGDDLSLLSISAFQNFNYPRISFNESGDPNDWYVATAFNNDRSLNNGFAEPSPASNDIFDAASCANTGQTDYRSSKYVCSGSFHPGEDWNIIGGGDRNQAVRAIADGIVLFAQSQNSSFGNIVIVGHKLDTGEIVGSVYAHLLYAPSVTPGSNVLKGTEIGLIGSAPSNAPHLHFEIVRQSLLKIDANGYIRIPVNESQNRGWYWAGTDTGFISQHYYDPSQFLKDRQPADPSIIQVYFEGTVNSIDAFGENLPNISVGDKIRGTYKLNLDVRESSQSSPDPNFGLYFEAVTDVEISVGPYSFSNGRPDELSIRNDDDVGGLGTVDLYGIYMFQNISGSIGNFIPETFVLQLVDPTASALSGIEIPSVMPSPSDYVSENSILRMPFFDDVDGGYFFVGATLEKHRTDVQPGRFELQSITGDWPGVRTGNRIEQFFTGVSGIPRSVTVFVREFLGFPHLGQPSAYHIDSLQICDEPELNSNCTFYVDLNGPITFHQADENGAQVTYQFPESFAVQLVPDKYFKVGLARATLPSQILEAGGALTDPIPYSDLYEAGGEPVPRGFDLFYIIETE